jgi:hypothetical protein
MALGPGFEIKNCTQWPLTISLDQVGPLYYDLVQPGEIFVAIPEPCGLPSRRSSLLTI